MSLPHPSPAPPIEPYLGLVRYLCSGYARCHLPDRRIAARSVRWGEHSDLADLQSEAFLALWMALAEYDPARGLEVATWLTWKTRRRLCDALRQIGRRWEREQTNVDMRDMRAFGAGLTLMPEPCPLEVAEEQEEVGRRVDEVLAIASRTLPLSELRAFLLRYQNDLPIARVAEITGQAEPTVRRLLHMARKRLRKAILATEAPLPGPHRWQASTRQKRRPPDPARAIDPLQRLMGRRAYYRARIDRTYDPIKVERIEARIAELTRQIEQIREARACPR